MMLQLEKLITNIFIGNDPLIQRLECPLKDFDKEKKEKLDEIKQKRKLTESQFSKQKEFINKLEDMTLRLSNGIKNVTEQYTIFKDVQNMVVVFDHTFNVLEYNSAFQKEFNLENEYNYIGTSLIFKDILSKIDKKNIKLNTIKIYNKNITYESEFFADIQNKQYKSTTSPIYDSLGNFNFFVQIYTQL